MTDSNTPTAEDIEDIWKGTTDFQEARIVCFDPMIIALGVQQDGSPYIAFSCDEKPTAMPTLESVRTVVRTKAKSTGENWTLVFVLENQTLTRAFSEMCASFIARISATSTLHDALNAIYSSVNEWQHLLKALSRSNTANLIRGVLGELLAATYINECTDCPIDSIIENWSGPYSAPQDFTFEAEKTAWEVKTIHSSAKDITISSPDQLDRDGWNLFLIVVELASGSESDSDQVTLTDAVRQVVNAANNPPHTEQMIEDGLWQLGISLTDEIATTEAFSVINISRFTIGEGFPRISTSEVPSGIDKVTYKIARHAIEPFRIAESHAAPQHGETER